jgi:hypothetical protein
LGCVNAALGIACITSAFLHRTGEAEVEPPLEDCDAEWDAERIRYELSFGLEGTDQRTPFDDPPVPFVGDYQTEGLGTVMRLTLHADGSYESEFCGCTGCSLKRGTFSLEPGGRISLQPEPPGSGTGHCQRPWWDTEPARTFQASDQDEIRVLLEVPDGGTRLYAAGQGFF